MDAKGTSFEGHAFFEGSSIRKVNGMYYLIYSSSVNHELCYAVSQYPDRGFEYGGVIISNGDIGVNGRKSKDRVAATGNNHGSIEQINGIWYIFYHRHTHLTSNSRQGCAEKIRIEKDGSIRQVCMTSCGLNRGPLAARRTALHGRDTVGPATLRSSLIRRRGSLTARPFPENTYRICMTGRERMAVCPRLSRKAE